jgi:UDP:flavonoid glycosyltransferase YjiC (YdhE family)
LQKYGHRVRLGTHEKFSEFVKSTGLEFYPIGGDPEDLMAYMVKNPGLIPSMESVREGDINRKRKMVAAMLDGCWASCVEPDPSTGTPFTADAIIANPPSFAHVHCAEALGIPTHIIFTMPWSATREFPHPLANVPSEHKDSRMANYLSYVVVEWLTWQGLGDIINRLRHSLGLEHVPTTEGPVLLQTLQVPHTYCWSPALVPRPTDWPGHVDVSGFLFRPTPEYTPPLELQAFLDSGPPPIYIGFGSIVLENSEQMSSILLDAIADCGVRAIISRGWSKLGGVERPDIFWLGDCPHEWLFQRVSMVIHHGGAGTTACGLLNGLPTVVVPFFGDQAFWGAMIAAAGSGPEPIHHKAISVELLVSAIRFCHTEAARSIASNIAAQVKAEDGVEAAVQSFHDKLPLERMRCQILPDQPAAWSTKTGGNVVRLSKLAAAILVEDGSVERKKLIP